MSIARSNSRFGITRENTGVRVVTLVLISVVAMLFTTLSCGRMANV